jgi:hypothetical protein
MRGCVSHGRARRRYLANVRRIRPSRLHRSAVRAGHDRGNQRRRPAVRGRKPAWRSRADDLRAGRPAHMVARRPRPASSVRLRAERPRAHRDRRRGRDQDLLACDLRRVHVHRAEDHGPGTNHLVPRGQSVVRARAHQHVPHGPVGDLDAAAQRRDHDDPAGRHDHHRDPDPGPALRHDVAPAVDHDTSAEWADDDRAGPSHGHAEQSRRPAERDDHDRDHPGQRPPEHPGIQRRNAHPGPRQRRPVASAAPCSTSKAGPCVSSCRAWWRRSLPTTRTGVCRPSHKARACKASPTTRPRVIFRA